MFDPLVTLSHSVYANKGVYAILLGSGISRPAEIPTGWEIMLDLINRAAHAEGNKIKGDPVTWYRKTKEREPNYSDLLNALAATPNERQAILQQYIEPSPEDLEEGRKTPTSAHRAIAELVSRGYIKVILTTNFDRLTENALRDVGIEPVVISSDDDIAGAPPLPHCKCVVIKLHGDYLDTRIRNTDVELNKYSKQANAYLDRILDEFGLIVCGWSGAWDNALRDAISRCPNRRYTTFWTTKSELNQLAQDIAAKRDARILTIKDANSFFNDLKERVLSLEELATPDPQSVALAKTMLKRYLAEGKHRIKLHELVINQIKDATEEFSKLNTQGDWSAEEFKRRVEAYERSTEISRYLITLGAYWADESQDDLWLETVKRFSRARRIESGLTVWIEMQSYPAILAFYSIGVAALAKGKYKLLEKLFTLPVSRDEDSKLAVFKMLPATCDISKDAWNKLPGLDRRYTPLSDHLQEILYPQFSDILADEKEFEELLGCFDLLAALCYGHHKYATLEDGTWFPPAQYNWRFSRRGVTGSLKDWLDSADKMGAKWPPLQAGMFGGALERYQKVKAAFDKFLPEMAKYYY